MSLEVLAKSRIRIVTPQADAPDEPTATTEAMTA